LVEDCREDDRGGINGAVEWRGAGGDDKTCLLPTDTPPTVDTTLRFSSLISFLGPDLSVALESIAIADIKVCRDSTVSAGETSSSSVELTLMIFGGITVAPPSRLARVLLSEAIEVAELALDRLFGRKRSGSCSEFVIDGVVVSADKE